MPHSSNGLNPALLIARKRDGGALTSSEIGAFIEGYSDGSIPDYQASSLCMAICLRGMNSDEITALTQHMLHSGVTLQWGNAKRPVVDKHSTGGVGDKVSLVLAPLLASVGLAVPMISGRGLGPTGGTLDKLESIPGFRTDLTARQLQEQTQQLGCAISGATHEIAPADQKLYALRDVTGTVPSRALITASILSKKLAEGLGALVLDVKYGSGALMKTERAAVELAECLVTTSAAMGVATTAFVTSMNQPLGTAVGNAIEVEEALDTLRGAGPADLRELTLALGTELMLLSDLASTELQAEATLQDALDSGTALQTFTEMVAAQGGDLARLPRPQQQTNIHSPATGFITRINTEALALAVIELGGGRRLPTDDINHQVGLKILHKVSDHIESGTPLLEIFAPSVAAEIGNQLQTAFTIETCRAERPPLIYRTLRSPAQ
ncbi:MAG: thymidine phosphorylase [Planctomycetaceae bacterium]|nr:thymidine phosphorylase [Planctomycetaceae bacterium]